MSSIDKTTIDSLLATGPHRSLEVQKELTLAFAGLYLATTSRTATPRLVWENDKTPYARYYVPVQSFHPDVKAQLSGSTGAANGHSKSTVSVKVLDELKGKGDEAVIERLTIGERSTTWVRFLSGPLKDFVRFERSEIDDWFENGAFFAGIRNPYKRIDTTPVAGDFVVKIDGEVVAETKVAVQLSETNLKDCYYLPATSVKSWGAISKSEHRTQCPYKGEAWYLNLDLNGKKYDNAIWYYMYPTHESAGVEGFISFYLKDNVELSIDGVKV